MLADELSRRIRVPLLQTANGGIVTAENWGSRREELLEILQRELYGYTPSGRAIVEGSIQSEMPKRICAGKVLGQQILLTVHAPFGDFSFPLAYLRPRAAERPPVFLLINFHPDIPDEYLPVEEITDRGYAVARIYYKDVVNDRHGGDFTDGCAAAYYKGRPREQSEWGKIGMWAYAASRALDYLLTRPDADHGHIIVIGHSRLGKTALWAAAQDDRFFAAMSNNSGICGAALTRAESDVSYGILGEPVERFLSAGSWDWYCERFKAAAGQESRRPFDQHFLLAAIAPRYFCVGSAQEDAGADPQMEFLSCCAAAEAYRLLGKRGFVTPDRFPVPGETLGDGEIGYHLRSGGHFLSRYDWNRYMDFCDAKILQEGQ